MIFYGRNCFALQHDCRRRVSQNQGRGINYTRGRRYTADLREERTKKGAADHLVAHLPQSVHRLIKPRDVRHFRWLMVQMSMAWNLGLLKFFLHICNKNGARCLRCFDNLRRLHMDIQKLWNSLEGHSVVIVLIAPVQRHVTIWLFADSVKLGIRMWSADLLVVITSTLLFYVLL